MKYLAKLIASSVVCIRLELDFLCSDAGSLKGVFSRYIVATDRGRVSPRQARYFLLLRQKRSTQRKGDPAVCVPSLRYGQTCITQFSLRCRPTRCAASPLHSNKRRQVRSQSNAVLWQRCPQPEPRAAGADTRGRVGFGRPVRLVTKYASNAYSSSCSSYLF